MAVLNNIKYDKTRGRNEIKTEIKSMGLKLEIETMNTFW